MRFAVASDDGIQIALHTGRCQQFAIFDVENQILKPVEVRTNRFTAHALGLCNPGQESESHSDHHSHDGLLNALYDCQALLCHGMERRLVNDLLSRNITPIFCAETEVSEAAAKYARGELQTEQVNFCSHC